MDGEGLFRQDFPYNCRVPNMTALQQQNLLIRQFQLVRHSNRKNSLIQADLNVTSDAAPVSTRFTKRSEDGIMVHPVFFAFHERETVYHEFDNAETDIPSLNNADPGTPMDDSDDWSRGDSPLRSFPLLAQKMVELSMLEIDKDYTPSLEKPETWILHRHSTYPEVFIHGDLLKLAFLDSSAQSCPLKAKAENSGFYRNECIYIWLNTMEHPHGYPHLLAFDPDEYGCLPGLVTFGTELLPDSYKDLIGHNYVCRPCANFMDAFWSNLRFLPYPELLQIIEKVKVSENYTGDFEYEYALESEIDEKTPPRVPFSSFTFNNLQLGEVAYQVFVADFLEIDAAWKLTDVAIRAHMLDRQSKGKFWMDYAGKSVSSKGVVTYYLVLHQAIRAQSLRPPLKENRNHNQFALE